MSNIKLSSDLFIGTPELKRFFQFLDIGEIDVDGNVSSGGFRKNILDNTVSFGLIKKNVTDIGTSNQVLQELSFENGRVQSDSDQNVSGTIFKAIKYSAIYGIDRDGLFLYGKPKDKILIPSNNQWYWIRASHQYSNVEKGVWNIDLNGNLTGTNGNLTQILRGEPEIPSKIRFQNAALNTLDYEVLEVIDDNTAILSGTSFQVESGLDLAVVGTFTYGVSILEQNKLIYNHDGCLVELVQEQVNNQTPAENTGFIKDKTFYLARVKSDGTNLYIQDKRSDFWETKGSQQILNVDRDQNPYIGIESIQWQSLLEPSHKNIVKIGWGIRSLSWSIDTNQNKLTLSGDVLGGLVKSSQDVLSQSLQGWRVYTKNGKYSRVISSLKVGSAIQLTLDVLNIDDYYTDGAGGSSARIAQSVLVVPDAEEILIKFTADQNISQLNDQIFSFPINSLTGDCAVTVYQDPSAAYNIQYKLKAFKEYADWFSLPSDTANGYLSEASFNSNGSQKAVNDLVRVEYTSDPILPYITLQMSQNAYSRLVTKIDKGDLVGVSTFTSIAQTTIQLKVGVALTHLLFRGDIVLQDNLAIQLDTSNAVSGNYFAIQFNCNSVDLNGKTISIITSQGSNFTVLKTLGKGDIYAMRNTDGGIILNAIYSGSEWILSQNYNLGRPYQLIDLDGVVTDMFDTDGLGKVKGLYGLALCNVSRIEEGIQIPDLSNRFKLGASDTKPSQSTGGSPEATLVLGNVPPHKHPVTRNSPDNGTNDRDFISGTRSNAKGKTDDTPIGNAGGVNGAATPFSILNPYYSVLIAKQLY